MARIELSNIGGGGGTLSLTTTGTSGASTLAGSVLNIPVYQGQLTLTTTGTSGAATLSGDILNIPQYSGGGGTPAGSTGQIQYNNAGAFGASANLAWDNSNVRLNVGAPSTPTGRLNVRGGGSSSATATQVWTNSGNTELMRLRDDGNLGIGTSTPAELISVVGSGSGASARTRLSVQNTSTSGAAAFVLTNGNGSTGTLQINGSLWPNGQAMDVATGSDIPINFYTNGNNPSGGTAPVSFYVGGYGVSAICQFRSTGVNIGHTATTPGARLHVVGANTTAGAGAFLVQDGAGTPATIYRIDNDGKITYRATNTAAGTTGAQTINRPSGTVNFAAGATALVVTNSLCTTASLVFAEVRTNDATAQIKNVVPAGGSFTINLGAAATAETSVGFFIIN